MGKVGESAPRSLFGSHPFAGRGRTATDRSKEFSGAGPVRCPTYVSSWTSPQQCYKVVYGNGDFAGYQFLVKTRY